MTHTAAGTVSACPQSQDPSCSVTHRAVLRLLTADTATRLPKATESAEQVQTGHSLSRLPPHCSRPLLLLSAHSDCSCSGEDLQHVNNKKKILLVSLCSSLLLSWYIYKTINSVQCPRMLYDMPDILKSQMLYDMPDILKPQMLYDKPDILNPQRTDVLTVTPWLAPIVWNGTFNRDLLNAQFHQVDVRVGLTVFAIKKYVRFLKVFIESAEKFFMVGHKVNYYVFTDLVDEISNFTLAEGRHLVILEVPAYERWQDVSMRRMEMIRDFTIKRFVNEVDYLACVDVDMVFLDDVGVEILSNVFGALHPGYFDKPRREFTYERRPESSAYIPFEAGDFYYAGGCFGGVIEEVIRLTNYSHQAMMADKQHNMEALWHDESYLNKYFLLHKPTKILSPEYIWHNFGNHPTVVQSKRFVWVDKNKQEVRF